MSQCVGPNPFFPFAHQWKSTTRVEEKSERKAEVGFSDCKRPLCPGFGLQPSRGSGDVSDQVHQGGTLHALRTEPLESLVILKDTL